jgi:hypothetical protein
METTDMRSMEERLAALGARIDELLAMRSHAELTFRLRGELDLWREWIDEARVQAALGAMEGRDRVQEAIKALEHLYSSMRKHLDLDDVADPLPGLERAIRDELRNASRMLWGPDAFGADA